MRPRAGGKARCQDDWSQDGAEGGAHGVQRSSARRSARWGQSSTGKERSHAERIAKQAERRRHEWQRVKRCGAEQVNAHPMRAELKHWDAFMMRATRASDAPKANQHIGSGHRPYVMVRYSLVCARAQHSESSYAALNGLRASEHHEQGSE